MLFMHMLQVLFIYAVAVVADAVYAYALKGMCNLFFFIL